LQLKKFDQIQQVELSLWRVLDETRKFGQPSDSSFLALLAAFILLRWLSFYDPSLQLQGYKSHKRFSSWSELSPMELREFFQWELPRQVDYLPHNSGWNACLRIIKEHINIESLPEALLFRIVDWVTRARLETQSDREILGEAFIRFIQKHIGNYRDFGQFVTPRVVAELMVELAAPKSRESIYDPCFGTGGLLVACIQHLHRVAETQQLEIGSQLHSQNIFGIERHPLLYLIGMVRLMLAGLDNPDLELGDTLEPITRHSGGLENNSKYEKFDCIVAVPPFGDSVDARVGWEFPIRSRYSETLFLQHIMTALRPGGRAIVALPERVLFSSGAEAKVRRRLLEEYRVEGIISLPQNAIAPYTGIKTSILVFSRHQPLKSVRFYEVPRLVESNSSKISQEYTQKYGVSEALSPRSIVREFRQSMQSEHIWETSVAKLAERGWELVAKKTGDEVVEEFLQSVHSADPKISIKRNWKPAEVFAGIKYQRSSTISGESSPHLENIARIIRVTDIKDGKIGFPALSCSLEHLNQKNLQRDQLQIGDLLVSISGTIGKVAVVSKEFVGSVASSSLAVIRPPSGISALYLSALLDSPSYQEWLKGHARGSVIGHLSITTLRQLPVPIPPLETQKRVARHTVDSAFDPTKRLLACLTQKDFEPIADWIETDSIILKVFFASRSAQREGSLALLLRVFKKILPLRNKIAHSSSQNDPILEHWLLILASGIYKMEGFESIPPGTARLAVLANVKISLIEALQSLTDLNAPLLKRAQEFTLGLIDLVDMQMQDQVEDVRVEVKLHPNPPVIAIAAPAEVILTLQNTGVMPIRQVSVSTLPEFGKAQTPYLAEGQRIDIPLAVPPQEAEGMLNFVVRWSGKLLNSERIEREIPLTIEIRPLDQISDQSIIFLTTHTGAGKTETALSFFLFELLEKDLGASPYIVGKPVDREAMFYGRRKEIDTIRRQLSTSDNANVILLEGNRRTGKTSILRYLQLEGKLPGWIIVECSFQEAKGDEDRVGLPTKEVFRLMAKKLGTAAIDAGLIVQLPNAPSYDPKRPLKTQFVRSLRQYFCEDYPFEDFELFLQSVLEAASPRRILFMLDEFDKLQEGIDSGVTSSQVPENIRYLFQTYSNLSGIVTRFRSLKRWREEYWSVLFGLGYRIGLDPLEPDEARELVTQPVEDRLVYVPQARDRVVELCARQPFLIQSLCNRIFERAAQTNERMITLSAVQAAADEMVRDNEHFRTLWDYAGTERRRFILSLSQKLEPGSDPVNMALLEIKLEEAEVLIPSRKHLGEDIEFLRELELLELDTTGALPVYKLAIPLMADWIRQNIDHEDLRRKAVEEGQENFL